MVLSDAQYQLRKNFAHKMHKHYFKHPVFQQADEKLTKHERNIFDLKKVLLCASN